MRTRIPLKLGAKTYRLLPGPGAMDRIGREVGDVPKMVLLLAIAKEIGGDPPELKQVVDVLHIALEESEYEIGKDDLWKLIYEHGAIKPDHYQAYAEFLGALVNSGRVPEVPEELEIEEPDAETEGAGAEPPKAGNRKERRAKKAKARARTGKPKS